MCDYGSNPTIEARQYDGHFKDTTSHSSKRNSETADHALNAPPAKRRKATSKASAIDSAAKVPGQLKRTSEQSLQDARQPSKRNRSSEPDKPSGSDRDPSPSAVAAQLFPVEPPDKKSISPRLRSRVMWSSPFLRELSARGEHDDLDTEVERRLEQNDRRRIERLESDGARQQSDVAMKRKRRSSGTASLDTNAGEDTTLLANTKDRRKRPRKFNRSESRDRELAMDEQKATRSAFDSENMLSKAKGKRRISAILDDGDDRLGFELINDPRSGRRRKKMALVNP